MKLFKVTDIDWDCDDDATSAEQRRECADALNLPDTAYVYTDAEDDVADALSDKFGFCIKTLAVEQVESPLVMH